ncbi:hypothetical protein OEV98_02390 [Caldibacillus lycopersici]|uniref:WYL domain-containing protein n=1 Tax=Perspicuibacillus lycopersici TaxID=1325689 RepID=A0AAE3IPW6_9BACI|nr:hypothetical protein [Perspicuibacillus lycopersici]MCU9612410.1 hypothetical protein [Perspicuibacillus lycopersici]
MYKLLLKSAQQQIPLEMIYESKHGNISKRVIYVKKISSTHMYAYCLTKKQYRSFLIDQILAIQPTNKQRKPTA